MTFFARSRGFYRDVAGLSIVVALWRPNALTIAAAVWCVAAAFFFDRVLRENASA